MNTIVKKVSELQHMKSDLAKEGVHDLLLKYGGNAFDIIVEIPKLLNMIEPAIINKMIKRNEISVFIHLPYLVNDFEALDEIWNTIISEAQAYEIGYNLWLIKNRERRRKCLMAYYDKVYPLSVERVGTKLNDEDNLIFDSAEDCKLFLAYWEKCGKPAVSSTFLEKLTTNAEIAEDDFAMELVDTLKKEAII